MPRLGWLGAVGLVVATACTSSSETGDRTSQLRQGISGGVDDTTSAFALGLKMGERGRCSAALIAKNLVLTARHCVSDIDTGGSIGPNSKFLGHDPPETLQVTTAPSFSADQFLPIAEVVVPANDTAQGNDIALLILASNMPDDAATATPVVQHAMFNTRRYSNAVVAVGYGVTMSGGRDSGERRIRQNIPIECVDGSANSCARLTDGSQRIVAPEEFLAGEGLCSGDSGSSAYDQRGFTSGTPISFGVASRVFSNGGGSSGSVCGTYVVYTRTDAHKAWIVQTALRAAAQGGYSPPDWTTAVAPDPEDTPVPEPQPKALGEACERSRDCASRQCVSFDGGRRCSQACTERARCPEGFICRSGYCDLAPAQTDGGVTPEAPAPAPPEAASTPVEAVSAGGGCSTTHTGTRSNESPYAIGIFVLIVLATRRRRRGVGRATGRR